MKIHTLERQQTLPIPPDVAWAFYANPHNLLSVYPPAMKVQLEGNPPKEVYPGLIMIIRARVGGFLPVQMVQEVTQIEKPTQNKPGLFVDEQRFGPFKFFHHQHHFKPTQHGTQVTDLVLYALPVGFAGDIAHGLFVRRQLESMFDMKEKAVIEYFGEP